MAETDVYGAAELLESDRCGVIISDLLWDAHKYPSCLVSVEISTRGVRSVRQCFSTVPFAEAENMPSLPFCK